MSTIERCKTREIHIHNSKCVIKLMRMASWHYQHAGLRQHRTITQMLAFKRLLSLQ